MVQKIFRVNLETKNRLSSLVQENYSKLKGSIFLLPFFLLTAIVFFLYSHHALNEAGYIEIQKKYFYFLNSELSQYPNLIYNLTQLGDSLICMSFLTIFIVYAPKIWEALLSASLFSLIFSSGLKNIFAIPRPAAILDNNSFVIIGKTLAGHSSLPSGHSITIFTVITVVLFAFLPKKNILKFLWCVFFLALGLLIAFTRVGVGAHFPLDVIIGSIFGFISGISGIFISQKYPIWSWINQKKYYPFFIILFLVCSIILINKILHGNLVIYDLAFISLVVSLYTISYVYVKK